MARPANRASSTVVAFRRDEAVVRILRQAAEQAVRLGWGTYLIRPVRDRAAAITALRYGAGEIFVVDGSSPDALEFLEASPRAMDSPASPQVLVYVGAEGLPARTAALLVDGHVDGVIAHDDPVIAVASTLSRAGALGLAFRALDALTGEVPERFVLLLRRAPPLARVPTEEDSQTFVLDAERLADLWLAGSGPRTLARELARAGLPTPGWIVRWLFALHAVVLRDHAGMKLRHVAHRLGLESEEVLRRRFHRIVALPPSRIDVDILLDAFRRRSGPDA